MRGFRNDRGRVRVAREGGDESKGERSSSGMKRRGASRAFEHVMKRERERERETGCGDADRFFGRRKGYKEEREEQLSRINYGRDMTVHWVIK